MKIEKLLPEVQKNILLKNYTTFKIGGMAKYFFVAKNKKDLIRAILVVKKINLVRNRRFLNGVKLPFFILGGGSNLLVSDSGFNGLVIKIENCKSKVENCKITADAGTQLSKLVRLSTEKGLMGLEWAAGIPGTVGGAVYGNAGWPSRKYTISSLVKWVKVLETKPKFKIKKYKLKECKFGYRDSVFKHRPGLVILSVCFKLKKGKKEEIKKEISEILKKRKEKTPAFFSAGSIFKNFTLRRKEFSGTEPKKFNELDKFKKTGMIPAGFLIEKCGLKGKKIGRAKISEKHANFIVNLGKAKAKDVKKLINLAKKAVKKKFKINLEEEIQYLGFKN